MFILPESKAIVTDLFTVVDFDTVDIKLSTSWNRIATLDQTDSAQSNAKFFVLKTTFTH